MNRRLINGFKLLEEIGYMDKLDEAIITGSKSYEQIVWELSKIPKNSEELYLKGYKWEELDMLEGDITSLIPYYGYRLIELKEYYKWNFTITQYLNQHVETPGLRKYILRSAYEGGYYE